MPKPIRAKTEAEADPKAKVPDSAIPISPTMVEAGIKVYRPGNYEQESKDLVKAIYAAMEAQARFESRQRHG